MKKVNWLIIVIFSVSFLSCEKEIELKDPGGANKVVLMGEFVAGDTVMFRAGKSAAVGAVAEKLAPLPDLQAELFAASGSWKLMPHINNLGTYNSHPYSTKAHIIMPAQNYKVVATHHSLGAVECDVTIPPPFDVTVVDTASTVIKGTQVLRLKLRFNDKAGPTKYAIEAVKQTGFIDSLFNYNGEQRSIYSNFLLYDSLKRSGLVFQLTADTVYSQNFVRIKIVTNDPNTENIRSGVATDRKVLLTDQAFDGGQYTTEVFLDKKYFAHSDYKGRVLIKVKSLSEDYFNYLKGYELQFGSQGTNSFDLPVVVGTNVKNGLGIVGGVYQRTFEYLFDKW